MTMQTASQSIPIMVVDFQPLMLFAIRSMMQSLGRVDILAEAHNTDEAIAQLQNMKPSLILYCGDEYASQMLNSVQRLTAATHVDEVRIPVCVFGNKHDPRFIAAALTAGAAGYLYTAHDGIELHRMIVALANGDHYENDDMRTAQAYLPVQNAQAMLRSLTTRERQILSQIMLGRSNDEIAAAIRIKISTVKKHAGNMFEKLQVKTRTEAIAFVLRNNLLMLLDSLVIS